MCPTRLLQLKNLKELRNQRTLDDAREAETRKADEATTALTEERRRAAARIAAVLAAISMEYSTVSTLHDFLRESIGLASEEFLSTGCQFMHIDLSGFVPVDF
jgi:hypothetical protein